MKKIVVNIILTGLFAMLLVVIIRPLLAEMSFGEARELAAGRSLEEARAKFKQAVAMDPFDSRYPAGFGLFLIQLSADYGGDKTALLKEAGDLYGRASELNPRNTEYPLRQGQIRLAALMADGKLFKFVDGGDGRQFMLVDKEGLKYIRQAFDNFRLAVRNDPNGFNTAYSVGYAGLSLWRHLEKNDRDLVLDSLRYCLRTKPPYARHIYMKLWRYTKDFALLEKITPDNLEANKGLYDFIVANNIWQFRKYQAGVVNRCKEREEPAAFAQEKAIERAVLAKIKKSSTPGAGPRVTISDWRGVSKEGGGLYTDGNMYWNGTMRAPILMPKGEAAVEIQAKGTSANGIYPYMLVSLDGEDIGETFVDSVEWKWYRFNVDTEGGVKVLSVTFANDGGNAGKKEDRNLYIGEARQAEESLKEGS